MKILLVRSMLLILISGMTCLKMSGQNYKPAQPFSEPKLLQDFLCAEVSYPEADLEEGRQGMVILSFIVESDGTVSNLQVKESVSPEIDSEAIRLFRMILWEPAISLGQPVASANEFPFKFNIKKYRKHCKERGYESTEYPYLPIDSSMAVYQFKQVDKPPYAMFQDKSMNLPVFIQKNIRYPEMAYRQSISGKVTVQFIIEPYGRISNIKVLNPVSGGCTQEAIRILQLIRWMPGIKGNLAVRTLTTLDVVFKLPEDTDMKMFENTQMNSN